MNLFQTEDPNKLLDKMRKLIGDDWFDILDNNILIDLYYVLDNINILEKDLGVKCYPKHEDCLRSMKLVKPKDVKAVILSKCPYPNDNADGIPFSCAKEYSASLKQIYFGCSKDENIIRTGDLSSYPMTLDHWAEQGILLLNRKHRVLENDPNSFDKSPWDEFVEHVIKVVHNKIDKSIIFFGWGAEGTSILSKVRKDLRSSDFEFYTEEHPVNAAKNHRYWICNHFDIINKELITKNEEPIKWY